MATVKEKFLDLLKGKGLNAEEAEAALVAFAPNLRFSERESEYPADFYSEKMPEIVALAQKQKADKAEAEKAAKEAEQAKAKAEAEAKAKAEAEKAKANQ